MTSTETERTAGRTTLAEIFGGTHAVIDLDSYTSNLQALQRLIGERDLMAIVKANAYGHGAVECARAAEEVGVKAFGVARIDEALHLRRAGIDAEILVIGPPNAIQVDVAVENDISLTVSTELSLEAVLETTKRQSKPARVHLKVDTGLHRYGSTPELAIELAKQMSKIDEIDLVGIYTHFSSSDEIDRAPTDAQLAKFHRVLDAIKAEGIEIPTVHFANSAAILTGILEGSTMARAGIACYGLDPSSEVPVTSEFKPVMSMRSVVARRSTLPLGEFVSYNRTYSAEIDEEVADIPIGYADGIERHLSNRAWFSHRGRRCNVLGRVCMDQTVISVPEDVSEGDEVIIFGDGSQGEMTVAELGELSDTNTYEPVVRISARVPRVYLRNGRVASWSRPFLNEHGEASSTN